MIRRPATTLVEVLIAIFIMAIGLMALMTYFPLGASYLSRAVQDVRSADLAANAAAQARAQWKKTWEDVVYQFPTTPQGYYRLLPGQPNHIGPIGRLPENFILALDDYNYERFQSPGPYPANDPNPKQQTYIPRALGDPTILGLPAMPPYPRSTVYQPTPNSSRPSNPVLIDPVGRYAHRLTGVTGKPWLQYWLPGAEEESPASFSPSNPTARPAIPRRTLNELDALVLQPIIRQFVLQDDLNFSPNGLAVDSTASLAEPERAGQYSCAWLFRRDASAARGSVNLTVLVYKGRSLDVPNREDAYAFVPDYFDENASVTGKQLKSGKLLYTTLKPAIRTGTWLLDATFDPTGPQGFFYQVTAVDDSLPGALLLEFASELKLRRPTPPVPLPSNYPPPNPVVLGPRTMVLIDTLVEVFEKGPIDITTPPRVN